MIQQQIPSNLGNNLVKQARLVLSDADIIAAPNTTDTIIIPAPGENLVIIASCYNELGNFLTYMRTWAADYDDIDSSCSISFFLGDNGPSGTYAGFDDFFAWGASGAFNVNFSLSAGLTIGGGNLNSITDFSNKPVYFKINNNLINFTGGDPSNSMEVLVSYMIYDVNSGLFVT